MTPGDIIKFTAELDKDGLVIKPEDHAILMGHTQNQKSAIAYLVNTGDVVELEIRGIFSHDGASVFTLLGLPEIRETIDNLKEIIATRPTKYRTRAWVFGKFLEPRKSNHPYTSIFLP